MSLLVVAPHGLDEVLGCGGTISNRATAGETAEILILFGDGTGRDSARREAAFEAAQVLGASRPRFGGFPENRGDTVPLLELVSAVERCVRDVSPESVFVSHGGNLNIDHQMANRATITALRPSPALTVRRLLSYEIASSTDWAPQGVGEPFRPASFVDISQSLEAKLRALEVYHDEVPPFPHARSAEAVRALATSRGAGVGLSAAEAFMLLREIWR